jgi:hypothetical protein
MCKRGTSSEVFQTLLALRLHKTASPVDQKDLIAGLISRLGGFHNNVRRTDVKGEKRFFREHWWLQPRPASKVSPTCTGTTDVESGSIATREQERMPERSHRIIAPEPHRTQQQWREKRLSGNQALSTLIEKGKCSIGVCQRGV